MPSNSKVRLGVKRKRVIAAASSLLMRRQRLALQRCLARSRGALAGAPASSRMVHWTYSHMWDEVNCKFQLAKHKKYRLARSQVGLQTIVQKGFMRFTLADLRTGRAGFFTEQWLCKPMHVESTGAGALLPAILRAQPQGLRLDDLQSLDQVAKSLTSCTLIFVGDKASGNVLLLKRMGRTWQEDVIAKLGPRILFMAESCGIHLHHRMKLQVKALRAHTMRHFGIANLHKLQSVQGQMLKLCELTVPRLVKRRVGAPPASRGERTLRNCIDALFKPDDKYHKRMGEKHSQHMQDLLALCEMVNGDLTAAEWTHWCWDACAQRPCCNSQAEAAEKTLIYTVNALIGRSDPVPAESRWTNTLSSFKTTLLRRAVYSIGLKCFHIDAAAATVHEVNADSEADINFAKKINETRIAKTMEYYQCDGNMHELAILTALLEVVDSTLLYPLLGDAVPRDSTSPCKVGRLLSKSDSLIGSCTQQLWNLMECWTAGHGRVWLILDVLQAPTTQQRYMKWARGQILRMASSVARRYETRFADWPYPLWKLACADFPEAEKRKVAEQLLEARRVELDCYSFGIRLRFPTLQKLLSPECSQVVLADLSSQPYGIDTIERMNAELTATHPRRAPARNFSNAARESVLRQACASHRANGGAHPLLPPKMSSSRSSEAVRACPLLPPLPANASAEEERGEVVDRPPLPSTSSSSATSSMSTAANPASHDEEHVVVALSESQDGQFFGDPLRIERSNPGSLGLGLANGTSQEQKRVIKTGLSPFLLECNKFIQSVKLAKGSNLTQAELAQARRDFKQRWDTMPNHEVFGEAFREWQNSAPEAQQGQMTPYVASWGCGCSETPITCDEFYRYIIEEGWPDDKEVYDTDCIECKVAADWPESFDEAAPYQLWGIGREARNIDRQTLPDRRKFELIEAGLTNFLGHVGKDVADSGELLLMIEGAPASPDSPTKRFLAFVSGTCYSPKVFDCVMCDFRRMGDAADDVLELPFDGRIRHRTCKIGEAFTTVDFQTSDEFILALSTRLASMSLASLQHDIVSTIDGSLLWFQVHTIDRIGTLWMDGLRHPLLHSVLADKRRVSMDMARLSKLRTSDPFAEPSSTPAASRGTQRRASSTSMSTSTRSRARVSDEAGAPMDVEAADAPVDVEAGAPVDDSAASVANAADPPSAAPGPGAAPVADMIDQMDMADDEMDLSGSDLDEFEAIFEDDDVAAGARAEQVPEAGADDDPGAWLRDPDEVGFVADLTKLVDDIGSDDAGGDGSQNKPAENTQPKSF